MADKDNICLFNKPFVVYGTGAVSKRLDKVIEKYDAYDNLLGYAVTSCGGQEIVNGKFVRKIEYYPRNVVVLVAVHSSIYLEIQSHLEKLGYTNAVWIYPMLFELCYGKPICIGKRCGVRQLISKLDGIYTHAIIYLAIENYYGKNRYGYALYLKFMESFCEQKTAKKRLDEFIAKIRQIEENGYEQIENICVTQDETVILDGAHRLILARYFGQDEVLVDIYPTDFNGYLCYSENIAMTKEALLRLYTGEEIIAIKEKYDELKGNFYETISDICNIR